MNKLRLLIVILTCIFALYFLIAEPKRDYKPDDFIGTYYCNKKDRTETLKIESDRTYTYSFSKDGSAPFINYGTWSFEKRKGKNEFTFNDFQFGDPEYGHGRRGFWVVEPEGPPEKIRFDLDPDITYYLQKIPQ